MNPKQAAAEADALSAKRGKLMMAMGALYISQQGIYVTGAVDGRPSLVKAIMWGVLTVTMLLLLMTRGHLASPREVRERLEDELVRANRARALAAGFVAAMVAGIICFYWTIAEQLTAKDVVHLIVSAGLGTAVLRFGWLEHRANADE